MSKFIFNVALLLVCLPAIAQEKTADTIEAPAKEQRYGIRVGTDLYRLARTTFDDNYQGFEIVGDYRVSRKFYAAAEIGNEKVTIDDDQVNFTTNGSYMKIGFDYNAYDNWLDMENMIYIGLRYGFSNFSQNLNSYKVYDNSGYFPENVVYPDQKYSGLTAHWGEVVGGIKAEILNNLYMGFSLRLNVMFTDKKPDNFDNLYIPGFNKTHDGNFGAGFNYTISYFIPFYKKGGAKMPEVKK
jgi:hypothetical protein